LLCAEGAEQNEPSRTAPSRRREGPVQYVVLTVVAIAAILITVDTVRHRADLRRRPNVYRAVTAALGGQVEAVDGARPLDVPPPGVETADRVGTAAC